jgi:hypothetical protein
MKICVIGLTRSRSTLFVETISNFYNIPIIGQEFNEVLPRQLADRPWLDDTVAPEIPQKHLAKVKFALNEINDSPTGVVRYHPEQLSFIPFSGSVLDLDLFNFKQYDKILFTVRRDIANMISSRFVATELNRWTYNFESQVHNKITPMSLGLPGYYHIKLALYNELIVSRLKDYLLTNNIQYEQVDYNDVPAYLDINFPSDHYQSTVETKYDYKSIVTNFDEIMELYEKFKPEVQELFNRFTK